MAKRRPKKDVGRLVAEMQGLVAAGGKLIKELPPAPRRAPQKRLALIKKALAGKNAFASLSKIRELVPNDSGGVHETVVYAYACILETNSSGLSIILDRFEGAELDRIIDALGSIGATSTRKDLKSLKAVYTRYVRKGEDPFDAAEHAAKYAAATGIEQKRTAHVAEVERQLLTFCKEHLDELAGN